MNMVTKNAQTQATAADSVGVKIPPITPPTPPSRSRAAFFSLGERPSTRTVRARAARHDGGNATGSVTTNWNNANAVHYDLTGNVTSQTWNNLKAGSTYVIEFDQASGQSRTIAWPSAIEWTTGSAPATVASNSRLIVVFYWDGTNQIANPFALVTVLAPD